MTEQEQNIAIAKACGWKNIEVCSCKTVFKGTPPPSGAGDEHIPNYTGSLDACHEAERACLTESGEVVDYDTHLETVVLRDWPGHGPIIDSMAWHATAAQRAEALLKTLNLWKP